jgi:sugar O-acyltransferase (sialic acid O-acetyltransferase NeuD family)
MTPLYIIGAGGHGRVVADIAEACGETDISFIDTQFPQRSTNLSWPIVGADPQDLPQTSRVVLAIGNNAQRRAMAQSLENKNFEYLTLVHPRAHVSRHARLGKGTVVMPMAVINAGSEVGHHVIVNTSSSIDHDCRIADFVHISPGAHLAGTVTVGEGSWVCLSAAVREGLAIGAGARVAAGAVVVRNVADGANIYGVPAAEKER